MSAAVAADGRAAEVVVVLFGPPGRGSFNESGAAGAERARAAGHAVRVQWIEPLDPEARATALAELCRDGPALVVAHGGQGDQPVASVAPAFPEVRFAITQGSHVAANVGCYEVLQEQSAFLAGVLAATISQSRRVGHFSGERVLPGLKGRAAYADGVRAASPGCTLFTAFCGRQHDPELAYDYVAAMAGEGVDVVFAMIDGGRDGVSRACRAFGIRQIGNVLDWVARDPAVFVASAIADSGRCVERAIADFAAGRFQPGTRRLFGLEEPELVSLVMRNDVPLLARAVVDDWSGRLRSGARHPAARYDGPEWDRPPEGPRPLSVRA